MVKSFLRPDLTRTAANRRHLYSNRSPLSLTSLVTLTFLSTSSPSTAFSFPAFDSFSGAPDFARFQNPCHSQLSFSFLFCDNSLVLSPFSILCPKIYFTTNPLSPFFFCQLFFFFCDSVFYLCQLSFLSLAFVFSLSQTLFHPNFISPQLHFLLLSLYTL